MKKEKGVDFKPEENLLKELKKQSKVLIDMISKNAKKNKCNLDVFLGGSFAKNTLVKKDSYDIDVFIKLDKKEFDKDLKKLIKIITSAAKEIKSEVKIIHGSRDYYQIKDKNNVIFEIIPVLKIKKPEEADNVTDLSYFHVNFIKRKLNTENLRKQVRLAKTFCAACDSYGAESYIHGFSGYALECLIVHYKSFGKMLRELSKAKETLIIDSEGHYKNKKDILIQLNESKLQSPVIVIDPTWKKRNALASLSKETFERFQKHAASYLKNKSIKLFEIKEVSKEELQKRALKIGEMLEIELETDKQEGDIAGTKLKKALNYILEQLRREYLVKGQYFVYGGQKTAKAYIIGIPKKELIMPGPPIKMKEHAAAFRKEHANVFEKKGKLYANEQVSQSMKEYFNNKIAKDVNLGLMSVKKVNVN